MEVNIIRREPAYAMTTYQHPTVPQSTNSLTWIGNDSVFNTVFNTEADVSQTDNFQLGNVVFSQMQSHESYSQGDSLVDISQIGNSNPLKNVLKEKIKSKRKSLGEPDIQVEFTQQKTYQLTPEEEIKNAIRRQRNKRSAIRCRQKRKTREQSLKVEYGILRDEHAKLKQEVSSLTVEREEYSRLIRSHQPKCQFRNMLTNVCEVFIPPV